MELVSDVVNNQLFLYFPVALVLVGAILVFTFGFKSAEQPPFDKLSSLSDDKKAATKKRKPKEKKATANGNAVTVSDTKTTKEKPSNKEAPTTPKQTKTKEPEKKKAIEVPKVNKPKTLEDQTNKKIKTKTASVKPVDYDDGSWETVPTKNDKKTKKQDSPAKKPKKPKSENVSKNDNNKDDNKENIKKLAEEILKKEVVAEDIPVVEEKKIKKEKTVKVEKEVVIQPTKVEQVEEVAKPVLEEPKDDKNKKKVEESAAPAESVASGGVAFDELGDVWTDTKAAKKSKKKSRRDN